MLQKTYIIAECGLNHQGDLLLAKDMIDVAQSIGCNCVKFQMFYEGEVNGLWSDIKQYWLSLSVLTALKKYCKEKEIDFLCSAFGLQSLMGVKLLSKTLKIPSGKIVDKEYLKYAAKNFDKFILSTGMANTLEIATAYDILEGRFVEKVTLLHCVSAYPTPIEDVNLLVLKDWLNCEDEPFVKIGLSDHTLGTDIAIAAVAMGAEVIEKHFTLSREMKGPDHHMSMEPLEMMNLVRSIRNVELAMGTGEKKCQESEKINLFRRE